MTLGAALLLAGCAAMRSERGPSAEPQTGRSFDVVRRLPAEEARQGVAVGRDHFYAVGNRTIGKYRKLDGRRVAVWQGAEDGPITHLNSGIVIGDRIYAAHSNYPDVPMESSIEIFDADTLAHEKTRSFGVFAGSATWVDRHAGSWWVGFANYEGRGGTPGQGPEHTQIVEIDDRWRPLRHYTFPPRVVERFGTRSNSGGVWGPDGLLYTTGHDAAELYVLALPAEGSVLELVEIVPVEAAGQGIALDPEDTSLLYTIIKRNREIIVSRMGRAGATAAASTER